MHRLFQAYRRLPMYVHALVGVHLLAATLAAGSWGLVAYGKWDVLKRPYLVCGHMPIIPADARTPESLTFIGVSWDKDRGPTLWFRPTTGLFPMFEQGWSIREALGYSHTPPATPAFRISPATSRKPGAS